MGQLDMGMPTGAARVSMLSMLFKATVPISSAGESTWVQRRRSCAGSTGQSAPSLAAQELWMAAIRLTVEDIHGCCLDHSLSLKLAAHPIQDHPGPAHARRCITPEYDGKFQASRAVQVGGRQELQDRSKAGAAGQIEGRSCRTDRRQELQDRSKAGAAGQIEGRSCRTDRRQELQDLKQGQHAGMGGGWPHLTRPVAGSIRAMHSVSHTLAHTSPSTHSSCRQAVDESEFCERGQPRQSAFTS